MARKMGYGDMMRVDIEWSIEGKNGTKTGKLIGLHDQEVAATKLALKGRARRGDTIIIREI